MLDRYRAAQDIPGISAVVIRHNEPVFVGGSGVADIETGRPVTADTVFYIGSVTKVLTATLVLHLAETQILTLADTVPGINDVDQQAEINVRQLLTHSSGLEREGDFNYWFTGEFPERESLAHYLSHTRLRSEPGTRLHYSNIGFAVLGGFIERKLDSSFGEVLTARILEPLGMSATGLPGPAADLAIGYTPIGRIIPSKSRSFAGVGRRIGNRNERNYHDAKSMGPAFGAYSTARDLANLALFLLGNGNDDVLSQEARTQMRQRQPLGRGLGVGLSRRNGNEVISHGGWFAAHRSRVLIDPVNGIAVIVLANSDSAAVGQIADALYDAALDTRPR